MTSQLNRCLHLFVSLYSFFSFLKLIMTCRWCVIYVTEDDNLNYAYVMITRLICGLCGPGLGSIPESGIDFNSNSNSRIGIGIASHGIGIGIAKWNWPELKRKFSEDFPPWYILDTSYCAPWGIFLTFILVHASTPVCTCPYPMYLCIMNKL